MKLLVMLMALAINSQAFAQYDGAYLDPLYKNMVHPKVVKSSNKGLESSNTLSVVEKMTPVKSQGSRGTCSIFSAIAMLEGMLVINEKFDNDIDLSEEYLEYTVVRNRTSDGSNSWSNFNAIRRYGVPTEATLPYDTQNWEKSPFLPMAQQRCGHLEGNKQTSCLIVHRDPALLTMTDEQILDEEQPFYDPEFVTARTEATQFKRNHISYSSNSFSVWNTQQIKQLLRRGIPLTLGIEFYYGAWNHRKADEFGIGRSAENWSKGIVGFPEPGSMDVKKSKENPAGHSVLIVGYDDTKIVETTVKMQDGTTKTFTYRGVYYFKNSWGTSSFGVTAEIEGETLPGYGMITQKHAHQHGSFYYMPLRK